jgi:hypothetical protein
MEAIKNQGIEMIKPDDGTVEKIEQLVGPANKRLITEGNLSREIVNTLNKHLQEYRALNAANR